MSKVTLPKCDVCDNIVNHVTKVYAYGFIYELCDNCYKDVSALEDMRHIHKTALDEIDKMINKKVEVMKNERKEDII